MRRLIAASLVLVLALTLVACGGGGDTPTDTQQPADSGDTPPPPVPAGAAGGVTVDRSPTETVSFEQFPEGGIVATVTPKVIAQNLAADQPMLIFYADSTQAETDDVRKEVDAVLASYRGLISLVAFDMRRGVAGTTKADPEVEKAALLADRLGVDSTPYILIVDAQGLITFRVRGPVDADLLEREVIRATK